jgi:hypothetical protein
MYWSTLSGSDSANIIFKNYRIGNLMSKRRGEKSDRMVSYASDGGRRNTSPPVNAIGLTNPKTDATGVSRQCKCRIYGYSV